MFKHAIVKKPGVTFAQGLTQANLGSPDYSLALKQHQEYCRALNQSGLSLTVLEPDDRYPDSCFVEDTAVITADFAVITIPGAVSRRGEIAEIQAVLAENFKRIYVIRLPGTLDGGDICQVNDRFYIGVSERTNEEGARQLSAILALEGCQGHLIFLGQRKKLLHLKSGMAYLGDNTMVLADELSGRPEFAEFNKIVVNAAESYAANCLRINDFILMPAGFPVLQAQLERAGHPVILLDMSEYRKMDGGLSCLSLRY